MKRFLYVLLSFAAVSFAVGCSEDDTITPAPEDPIENPLVYEVDQVVFGSQKSEKVITLQNIESDNFMITKPDADKWVSFKKGEGNTIVVSVKANATDIRESKITAQSGRIVEEIPIWQDAPRSIRFPQIPDLRGTGGSTTFGFTANIAAPFEVKVAEADQSWLKITVDNDAMTVTATVGQNIPKAGDRTGSFTISGYSEFGDYVETEVSVTQVGIDRPNYKFSLPDFSQSKVYKVMENGKQIAEVCLEFLGDENAAATVAVDAQAVVVYPMAADGKADLTNGYVAKIVKANDGTGTFTYPAPTTAVHGGKVAWDAANNCISAYTAGTVAAPVETVVIPADNFVFTAEPFAEMTELSTEPYVVNDNRANDTPRVYTVVKVATQYWLGENLKAKCWTDGTKIPTLDKAGWKENKSPAAMAISIGSWKLTDSNTAPDAEIYYDLWKAENQEDIETVISDFGVLYNPLCIVGKYNDTGLEIKDFLLSAEVSAVSAKDAAVNDLLSENDKLSPEGWSVPTRANIQALKNYTVSDVPLNTDVTNARPMFRRNRQLTGYATGLDYSQWSTKRDDENITGLSLKFNAFYNINQQGKRPNASNYLYMATRSLQPAQSGMEFWTSSNTAYMNRNMKYCCGMPIRCIRK